VTAREAQLARIAYLLREGANNAGITIGAQNTQRLAMSIQNVMEANHLHLMWQREIDQAAEELVK
jgi:hypothetical protein